MDRSTTHFMKDDTASRRNQGTAGSHTRNKSYDFLLANKHQGKSSHGHPGANQGANKSIISMWGYMRGLGVEDDFDKIGEIDEEIADISFADGHVFLLTDVNNILVRGTNDSKQLGFDSKETLLSFKLPSSVRYIRVECGGDFTFALGKDGEVFSWGLNIKGQLGHGHFEPVSSAAQLRYLSYSGDSKSPRMSRKSKDNNDDVKLTFGEKITDVACGALHSLLLTNKGRVFASGFNETYALGNGNTENQCTFSEVPFFSSGQAYDRNITKLAAGVSHSACIIQDTAYVWGVWGTQQNMINQTPAAVQMSSIQGFGNQAISDPVVDVKLGDLLSVFLTSKGDVYTMGENFSGQLGIGEHKQQYSNPVRVNLELPVSGISCGTNHVFAYSKDCRAIYAWGSNMQHQILTSPNSANHYSSPTKLNHLLSSATTKIICKSRGTITISKLPVDSGKDEKSGISMISANSDNVKKLEMLMFAEKNEKENFKKTNMILGTENNQLKQELIQLKSALANAERSQKKILSLSVSTQTLGDVEESDPTFDGRLELISHAAF